MGPLIFFNFQHMLPCPLHFLTGLNCPFCGAQRMIVALAHGQLAEAFWLNPGLAIGAPLVAAWWAYKGKLSTPAATAVLLCAVAWGIIRNLLQL